MSQQLIQQKFFTGATKELAKQCIVDICQVSEIDLFDEPPSKREHMDDDDRSSANCSKVWECMSKILEDSGETDDIASTSGIELNSYLRELLISFQRRNPYIWWNKNQRRYSLPATSARRYLSAPPTSVPLEILFSGAEAGSIYMYDNHRSRLTADKVEMLLSNQV